MEIWEFIELLRHRVSWGYVYFYIFEQKKPEKDAEIRQYYKADLKKYQRSYRKKVLNLRNYFYMRFGKQGIILSTEGQHDPDLTHIKEFFKDARREPLTLKISDITTLKIYAQPRKQKRTYKVLVLLSRETTKIIKTNLLQILKQNANPTSKQEKSAKTAIKKSWLVNGYPSFAGLLEQKKELKRWYIKESRTRGINIKQEDLKLSYFRRNRLKNS